MTYSLTVERSGHANGMDYEVEYTIEYDYVAGAPDHYDPAVGGPGGWEPGYAAEIQFVSVGPVGDHGAFTDLAQANLDEWAKEWLEENREEAIANAERARQPDPDDARDQALENERMARDDGTDYD